MTIRAGQAETILQFSLFKQSFISSSTDIAIQKLVFARSYIGVVLEEKEINRRRDC